MERDQLDRVLAAYGLAGPVSCTALGGSCTENLRIDGAAAESLVLRIHQPHTTPERLTAIQSARRAAAAAGIPAVTPLPAADDRYFVELPDGRHAELEPFVAWTARMNTAPLLERGFEVLGRLHDVLRTAALPEAAKHAAQANHLSAEESVAKGRLGADRVRSWGGRLYESLADRVVRHLEQVAAAEEPLLAAMPRQTVHGDFWDNNVLFHRDDLVALLDFDFMGERHRIDDLALPCYFYLLEPGKDLPTATDRRQLRRFADAYDRGTETPLTPAERLELPLAIARQPAWSIGRWIVELDEPEARDHAAYLIEELPVAQAILAELPEWQAALS